MPLTLVYSSCCLCCLFGYYVLGYVYIFLVYFVFAKAVSYGGEVLLYLSRLSALHIGSLETSLGWKMATAINL